MHRDVLQIRCIAAVGLLAAIALAGPLHLALVPHHSHDGAVHCAHCASTAAALHTASSEVPAIAFASIEPMPRTAVLPVTFSGAHFFRRGPPSSFC